MKCLIADSSATMRRIMRNALRGHGELIAIEVNDGMVAMEKLGESPDLVIADWNLPRVSGLDLLKSARARTETANIPIILVSSRNRREDIEQAVANQVSGYIVRPFAMDTLRDRVKLLIPARPE